MREEQGKYYTDRVWAIQSTHSTKRRWKGSDLSIVQFSHYTNSIITELQFVTQVQPGDVVLKVKGRNEFLAMGEVIKVDFEDVSAIIHIRWISEINSFETSDPLFDPSSELQRINQNKIRKLNLPLFINQSMTSLPEIDASAPPDFDYKDFNPGPPKMGNGGGSGDSNYGSGGMLPQSDDMMESAPPMEDDHTSAAAPPPMAEMSGAAPDDITFAEPPEPTDTIPKEDPGGKVSLFYCTNRKKTESTNINKFYGAELVEPNFGTCEVTIPPGHSQGKIERPRNYIIFKMRENADRHIVVSNINEKSEKDFFSDMVNDLGATADKSAFIFVHGYNTTFSEAAWRTAQIAWDIPFKGIAGFFSWPSSGETIRYLQDIEKADSSIGHLEAFIEKMIVNTQVENVHIIAHSMGNRIATHALNNLSRKPSFASNMQKIKQVVLCAPDLDQTVFNNSILPYFKSIGVRRTLYCSEKDKALAFSEKLRSQPRLGDAGNSLYVATGIDTIDASNVNSLGNHHSYIFETKEVLTDLHFLLGNNFSPQERRLKSRKKGELDYWLFPE